LQEAYDVLSDEENRKLYNQHGDNWRAVKQGGGAPPPGWEAQEVRADHRLVDLTLETLILAASAAAEGFDV